MEEVTPESTEELTFWDQHRFMLLIALTIIISLILVSISLVIYNLSGASQLDLSRPGYISVSKEAVDDESSFANYSSSGAINASSISEFKTLYDKQVTTATTVDAFGGDPLNPDTLGFSSTTSQ